MQAILSALAELGGTDQVGLVVERTPDRAYRVVAENKPPVEALAAFFHLDERQNQPAILQLSGLNSPLYSTFRENGWYSTVRVPVNREKFSIMVWAARGEDMPGFNEPELTAFVLLAQYAALMFESLGGQANFEHLFGGSSLEQGEVMGARLSGMGRLREGNAGLSYSTSGAFKGKSDVHSPGVEIIFNDKKRTITNGTATVHLTMTEARLFQALWNHRNEMLLHVELVQMTHGYQVNAEEASKILRPVVSRLRKKLRAFIHGERWIKNVRGTGYVMGEF